MDYGHDDVGPALKRLREAAGLAQNQLAAKIGRSGANVSRIERAGCNPKLASLLRYLEAIGADLEDLHRELRESVDPLDEAVAAVHQRIIDDPTYRQLARGMLERFGGPEPPPALRALADLIDRQGEQIEQHSLEMGEVKGRLGELEQKAPEADEALPDGPGEGRGGR